MALGEQYQWPIRRGVQGPDGKPKTLGIGLGVQNGRIIINSNGWAALDQEAIDYFKDCFRWAEEAAERQRQGRS